MIQSFQLQYFLVQKSLFAHWTDVCSIVARFVTKSSAANESYGTVWFTTKRFSLYEDLIIQKRRPFQRRVSGKESFRSRESLYGRNGGRLPSRCYSLCEDTKWNSHLKIHTPLSHQEISILPFRQCHYSFPFENLTFPSENLLCRLIGCCCSVLYEHAVTHRPGRL